MAENLALITHFTSIPVLSWFVVWWIYRDAVRGTRMRYICRTIMRPLNFVVPVHWILRLMTEAVEGNWWWVALDLFNLCWTTYEIAKFHESDEDDWWKKTGKRLRRWVRSYTRSLVLKPISITTR